MEVKIDYTYELIENEKIKIKWVAQEFDAQFGDLKELSEENIVRGLEFLDYIISSVEVEDPEVLAFLRTTLERLEKQYPMFFN